jgi:hypothetical protein
VPLLVLGQVYRWVDTAGEEHFTNDRSSIPKSAKVLPFEPGEADVSIGTVDEAPQKPARAHERPPPPPPSRATPREEEEDEPDATVTLSPLPKSLKPGDAEILLGAVQQALDSPRLRAFGGLLKTIHLDVIEKSDDPRLRGAPEWAGGLAVSPTQVYLLSPYIGAVGYGRPRYWAQMTVHEVAHAQSFQWAGAKPMPRWFMEGYAMYVSTQEAGASQEDVAWWAIAKGEGAPLTNAFKAGPARPMLRGGERADQALMDYSMSLRGLELMVKTRGESSVALLLKGMRDGLDFSAAFKKAMGLDLRAFEALFLETLKPDFHDRAQ